MHLTCFPILVTLFLSSVGVEAAQGQWQQCGGIGWTGGTTCTSPFTCQILNPYYYQCLSPSSSGTTRTRTTTTTTKTTTTAKASATTISTTSKGTTTSSTLRTTSTTKTTSSPTSTSSGTVYRVVDTFVGSSFLSEFQHIAIPDPTNGRVNYTDQAFALSQNLTFVSSDTLVMRADSWTTLSASGPGRNSVRIQSNKEYTTAVTVINVRHMPQGCATWPAFWTTQTSNWPANGEIDIIEGVNDVSPNQSTLHSSPGCTMSAATMTQTGPLVTTDCNTAVNGNAGCGVQVNKGSSYGPDFNAAGGGWYAMERTSSRVNLWFWGRHDSTLPAEIASGLGTVSPTTWGIPYANFVNNNCDFGSHFGPENIIINLTLCGDWAGNVYPSSCPKTCIDHVNQDPSSFQQAYWDIASLRVYQ